MTDAGVVYNTHGPSDRYPSDVLTYVILITYYEISYFVNSHIMASDNTHWKSLCLARKQKQFLSIPKQWLIPDNNCINVLQVPYTCGMLSPKEIEITDTTDLNLLLTKLSTAEWSSLQVTTAFYKRAIIAHQLVRFCFLCIPCQSIGSRFLCQTNCLTEIFVDRALERARYVDDHLRRTGKPIGPLHGLPISLKDQFSMKGLETIMGVSDLASSTLVCSSNTFHNLN